MWKAIRIVISLLLSMNLVFSSIFAGSKINHAMPEPECGEYCSQVNLFTGTGGYPWMCGMLSPAATAPFGCVRLGPDTSAIGGIALIKTNTSGYYYEHRHILGFSFGRLSGTGARDYGMFRVTPSVGTSLSAKPKALVFSHNSETASPGYYAVYLPGAASLCEMTATSHTGLQRYTFDTAKDAKLYFDASSIISGGSTYDAVIRADVSSNSLTAKVTLDGTFTGRFGGLTVYCYAEWNRDLKSVTAHTDNGDNENQPSAEGNGAGLLLNFGNIKNQPVTLRTGISFISAENAKENLAAEVGTQDFDTIRMQAAQEWEDALSAIRVDADAQTKQTFYTMLYHTMIMPTDFTDANGEYLGFDNNVHTAVGFTYRTDMSLWDTCRNVHALYTLIAPQIQKDCIESLLLMAEQGGVLPRWPMGNGYTGSMFGNPANVVLAESYLKGLSFDLEKAYEYVKFSTDGEHPGKAQRAGAEIYNTYGYLPSDIAPDQAVSRTIEYSWEDAAAAILAEAAGKKEDAEAYSRRSMNYKNLWDDETKYFRAKNSDGTWGKLIPGISSYFDEIFGTSLFEAYCEGSADQWRWGALHDTKGLIELFGSESYFVDELNAFMEDAAPKRAYLDPGGGFWIGNQHDIHTPYLFNEAGRGDLTQKWVRWTLQTRFSTDIDGLDGNDDGGTTSAWYVFSALGFYPIAGSDQYWIGSPAVSNAELQLENGNMLNIVVNHQSEKNVYVSSVTLNGKPVTDYRISHADIANGGELIFTMSDTP